jgi:hypothetical protein
MHGVDIEHSFFDIYTSDYFKALDHRRVGSQPATATSPTDSPQGAIVDYSVEARHKKNETREEPAYEFSRDQMRVEAIVPPPRNYSLHSHIWGEGKISE